MCYALFSDTPHCRHLVHEHMGEPVIYGLLISLQCSVVYVVMELLAYKLHTSIS